MWNPINIRMMNLFAHKDSYYEFKNNACTVIFGQNKTDKGMDNNGAGKTTLFEAICIALTNESLRNIKKDNFINRDSSSCRIEFELFNPVMRMTLKIVREFYRSGKSTKVEIWENGELNTQITSVNEANRRVLELIGVSREDLLRYFIISQDNNYTFFTASDTEKKEIMNRITSADMINPIMDELALRLHEKQAVYNDLDSYVSKLSERKETLEEQRQEMLESDDTAERISGIRDKINDANSNIAEYESKLEKMKKRQVNIDSEISNIHVEDTTDLNNSRKRKKSELENLESEITDNKRVKRNLESELQDTIECPKCGYEFIHKSDLGLSVEDAKRLLAETQKEIKEASIKVEKKNAEISKITERIRKAEADQDQVNELEDEKKQLKRRVASYSEIIQDLKTKIERWKKDIEDLKKQKSDDSALKNLNAKISECEKEIKQKTEEMKPIDEELDMIKYWQFHMGKSGFMTYLANRSVKIIEGITNSYLRKFGVDISVLINGFTILRSGEVREKIDVFVSSDGITAESFMAKSGGERGRVMLALTSKGYIKRTTADTFKSQNRGGVGVKGMTTNEEDNVEHLINLSTNGKGLNLLVLDEALSGIDAGGTLEIINTLNNLGTTVMMITQNIEDSSIFENCIRVVKEDGVSTLQS